MTTAYRAQIVDAAKRHGLDADLIEGIVVVESSGKPYAYRFEPAFWQHYLANNAEYSGANPERVSASYGLMQIMYSVAKEHGFTSPDPEHLFVPDIGLEYGCRLIAQLLAWAKGNVTQALAAYNGGEGGNSVAPFRNQAYADKVIAARATVKAARQGTV